ncbi:MAG: CBS domain-containing protein [Chloroflexi bacterium]|nr:CBS domain-containing protein [Chloroflexota bacterium]
MSPRAAWRLESLGFRDVYDYVAGKADWSASGLPTEGRLAGRERAGDLVREVPACLLRDRLAEARERMRKATTDVCMVVNEHGIVLGRVRETSSGANADTPVESVMEAGPSTFRPNVPLEEMETYMRRHRMGSAVITTSAGRLVGVLYRQDVERRARSGLAPERP